MNEKPMEEIDDDHFEERYKMNLNYKGKDYEIEILDATLDEEKDYQMMLDLWIPFGDGFLLVFSIDDKESLEILKGCNKIINRIKRYDTPIILIGNKQDLKNDRKITFKEAKTQADLLRIEYIETSAKTNYNCKKAFEKLIKMIVKIKNKPIYRPPLCSII